MNIFLYAVMLVAPICLSDWRQEAKQNRECNFAKYGIIRRTSGKTPTVKRVTPKYPPFAKAAKIEGTVEVEILIDQKGKVVTTCAATGPPLLKDAAIKAALQWKFKRQPTYVLDHIVFNFKL
jgi:periplasmic protein TonB